MNHLLTLCIILPFLAAAQPSETFKNWFSGQTAVLACDVEVEIEKPGGKSTEYRFRFGSQPDTYWSEIDDGAVVLAGASYDYLWESTEDKSVRIADRPQHSNTPNPYAGRAAALIAGLFAGGFADCDPHSARWVSDDLIVISRALDRMPSPANTNDVELRIEARTNGLPERLVATSNGKPEGVVHLEYGGEIPIGIPSVVSKTGTNGTIVSYKLEKLKLGTRNVETSRGYVPAMFLTTQTPDFRYLAWTNILRK